MIAQGETEDLLQVLAERQGYVEQLGALNRELAGYRERWPELSRTLPAARRDEINGLLEEVESLLEAIIAQDDRDRAQLAQARDEVAGQMRHTTQAGRAVNAYAQAAGGGPPSSAQASPARFTDGRG